MSLFEARQQLLAHLEGGLEYHGSRESLAIYRPSRLTATVAAYSSAVI